MAKFDQSVFDSKVANMSWLYRGFVFYARSHWDPM
jgi:hypothetical protein